MHRNLLAHSDQTRFRFDEKEVKMEEEPERQERMKVSDGEHRKKETGE